MTHNAPSRSIRRSGHPILAIAALRLRAFDRDQICGEHYGQRPSPSAALKGRTDGSTDQHRITVKKAFANNEPSTDAATAGVTDRYVARLLPLAFLAPDIVETILDGRQPADLDLDRLLKDLPTTWSDQRRVLGFTANA